MSKLNCARCHAVLTMREYSPGHTGLEVYRCSDCAASLVRNKGNIPDSFDSRTQTIESRMMPCDCGGHFSRQNLQRCPECGSVLDMTDILPPQHKITKRDSQEFYPDGCQRPLLWTKADQPGQKP